MTTHKHFKLRVRARMAKTGERYATARRHLLAYSDRDVTLPLALHVPGNVPATTALRGLLARAGVLAPQSGRPFSEALLFGIAGGIGLGVAAFHYQRDDSSSFFLAGRHRWWDDLAYMRQALAHFGMQPVIYETGSATTAAAQLRTLLDQYGACIAWVDMAALPWRAMPAAWDGGGYHVVTIYGIDDAASTALIGDVADEPVPIALSVLAQARGRIKKQRHRLLAVAPPHATPELPSLVRAGIAACRAELDQPSLPAPAMGRLDALRVWAARMHGTTTKDSWQRVFRPGRRMLAGLSAIYDFIEHYGTGGGLSRPAFASFLEEAAAAVPDPALRAAAVQYAELGAHWSALADAALPDDVPLLAEAKHLYARKAELLHEGAPADEVTVVWNRLAELDALADEQFPLPESAYDALRAGLKQRILALYAGETAALAGLQDVPA